LSPLLAKLVKDKRVLALDQPLSTQAGKPGLYRVADSNLRLYLAALRSAAEQVRRGRPDAAYRLVERRWTAWRGRAVEPLIRESLELAAAAGALPWPQVEAVGGWWNRRFDPEVDLVGTDRTPVASTIHFVGSVKWLSEAFDRRDLHALRRSGAEVPGYDAAETGVAVVSLSGVTGGLDLGANDAVWGPGGHRRCVAIGLRRTGPNSESLYCGAVRSPPDVLGQRGRGDRSPGDANEAGREPGRHGIDDQTQTCRSVILTSKSVYRGSRHRSGTVYQSPVNPSRKLRRFESVTRHILIDRP
jgi:hypothetical protein